MLNLHKGVILRSDLGIYVHFYYNSLKSDIFQRVTQQPKFEKCKCGLDLWSKVGLA